MLLLACEIFMCQFMIATRWRKSIFSFLDGKIQSQCIMVFKQKCTKNENYLVALQKCYILNSVIFKICLCLLIGNTSKWLHIIFTYINVFFLFQILDLGVVFHPGAYLRDVWNVMDSLVVSCALVSFYFQ